MSKHLFELPTRTLESLESKVDRLDRQLYEARARADKAFDQGAAMVLRALELGATPEEIKLKIRWEHVDPPERARTKTEELAPPPIPMEMHDSDEHTEPMALIPTIPRYPRAQTEPGH